MANPNIFEQLALMMEAQVALLQSQIATIRSGRFAEIAVSQAAAAAAAASTGEKKGEEPKDEEEGKKKKRKKREPVDPNKPKQPLSNYMLFSQERMAAYRAKQPERTTSELMTVIGKEWAELSVERKAIYTSMATALRTEYQGQLAAYNAIKNGPSSPSSSVDSSPVSRPLISRPVSTPLPIVIPPKPIVSSVPVVVPPSASVVPPSGTVEKKKKKKRSIDETIVAAPKEAIHVETVATVSSEDIERAEKKAKKAKKARKEETA